MPLNFTRASKRKDFGDFQTPQALVTEVIDTLEGQGVRPARILEPTCGEGRFLTELLDRPSPPLEFQGIEIQPEHASIARSIIDPTGRTVVTVQTADLFTFDLKSDLRWVEAGPLLVVGNLPWVTTSALGASGGVNGPKKTNHRGRRGIDALTGESNFDISEAIWHKLISELAHERPTIALLCKTAVARSVLRAIATADLPIIRAKLWRIDAHRWFRASVDACLLRVEVGPGPKAIQAEVYAELSAKEPESILGFESGRLIADIATYRRVEFADAPCPLQWRQGVKHDAAAIMELSGRVGGTLRNKVGEIVDIEQDFVFPLRKGTDLASSHPPDLPRWVIVTQNALRDDTHILERTAPRLWAYLSAHAEAFGRRKSSIYRGRPPFSMFGIGNYSFAPFKVAISGLHKEPRFRVVATEDDRPVLFDDTCYFLPCRTIEQAEMLAETLNGPEALDLLRSLTFRDSKRPVTKAVLQRMGLKQLLERAGLAEAWRPEWETDWTKGCRDSSIVSSLTH